MLRRDSKTEAKILDKYSSCANEKKTSCETYCTDDLDPCYIKNKQNVTWASWHVSNGSQVVDLEHLKYPLDELTVASVVNGEEKLEIVFKGEEPQDTMQVDVLRNIDFNGQMAIKIDDILKYNMAKPGKLYGVTVG